MGAASRKIKRSSASLKGGIVVGVCVAILTMLIARDLGYPPLLQWLPSLIVGGVMGAWVRIADL